MTGVPRERMVEHAVASQRRLRGGFCNPVLHAPWDANWRGLTDVSCMVELLVRFDGTAGENAAALTDFVRSAKGVESLAVSLEAHRENVFEPGALMRVVDEDAASEEELAATLRLLMAPSRWAPAFTIMPADTT